MPPLRFPLLIVSVLCLVAPLEGASDAALLDQARGMYFGRERGIVKAPPELRGRDNLSGRYTMPRGRGVMRAVLRDRVGAGRGRVVASIKRVRCRGNRVIFSGVARLRLGGRALTSPRFRAIATVSGSTATLKTYGTYTRGLAGNRVKYRGVFTGSK